MVSVIYCLVMLTLMGVFGFIEALGDFQGEIIRGLMDYPNDPMEQVDRDWSI
jgi:hypothetical protein